ncbi:hypothetical protein R69608_05100 [Paraburkholderia nemoris]|uniref:hypothetical protein n=1 Tax=Paraburkholderia nemoris TaxID=2793076 RepID=UPI0019115A53|nr:hypothetical protein [Paraburkholderia nemoris]MBK5149695.1 hypothetical protein [Burkholderia sp. R-69608]CAE6938579.1 hypothetical protein R69608_05100 [Paraburkholderia nemoris]
MAAKNFTLVHTPSNPDDLETGDTQYVASLERAIDDLTDAHGKLTFLLGLAHRDLKQERERRNALEMQLLGG